MPLAVMSESSELSARAAGGVLVLRSGFVLKKDEEQHINMAESSREGENTQNIAY